MVGIRVRIGGLERMGAEGDGERGAAAWMG